MKTALKTLIAAATLATATLIAGSDSASLTIRGYVTEIVDVTITPTSGYDSLNLGSSIVDQEIAKINIASNAKDGFTVTLSTTNNLNFKGNGAAQQTARYTLKYTTTSGTVKTVGKAGDGADVTYTDGTGATLENLGTRTSATNATNLSLKINYTSAGLLWEPQFDDTMTLTVTSK